MTFARFLAVFFAISFAAAAYAAESEPHSNARLTAVLLTAEDGVRPDASTLSAALYIDLATNWKTYWRSPGEVGYPPTIDWSSSSNVAGAEFFWPTPERFVAFDVENYGYEKQVVFPLRVMLNEPGQPAHLVAKVGLLTCAEICVPEEFEIDISLPVGSGIDTGVAEEIADAIAKVPGDGSSIGLSVSATRMVDDTLEVSLDKSGAFSEDPVVFPDLGEYGAFGPPEYDYALDRSSVLVSLPVLSLPEDAPPLKLVVATEGGAAEFTPEVLSGASSSSGPVSPSLLTILLFAFMGGLILNVMPCVLPVLSIKLTSAMTMQDKSPSRIRGGFLASALGVLTFMWTLALVLILVRVAGGSIGWGIQFQSPVFLALMISIMVLFAANMAGFFEISLPQSMNTRLATADGSSGLSGDFATGALAAVLATPCSAPFLGTAVTVALAGAAPLTFTIFTALGVGLALPYLLVAVRPNLISALPRPGHWMLYVRWFLAALLAGTAVWLAFVLGRVNGWTTVALVLGLLAATLLVVGFGKAGGWKPILASILLLTAIATPSILPTPDHGATAAGSELGYWTDWRQEEISEHVALGKTVFVDVTADWCLTCKTNKTLVLDREPVADLLESDSVVAMRADWTRPNDAILNYLQAHGRFGIPFNIVYGPGATEGITLPEVLTTDAVTAAIEQAR